MRTNIALMNAPHLNTKGFCGSFTKSAGLIGAGGIKIDMGVVAGDICDLFNVATVQGRAKSCNPWETHMFCAWFATSICVDSEVRALRRF